MKKRTLIHAFLALFSATLLFSCGTSKENLQNQIKSSFQEKMNNDESYSKYNIIVNGVTLVKASNNTYDGLVNVSLEDQKYDVPITVTTDGENMMWQTKPLAFGFLAQYELKKLGF